MDLKDHIRAIPDHPKPGILFYDISTLLRHGPAWRETVKRLRAAIEPYRPELLAGIESRGFPVVAALAHELGCGFTMIRKQGKLPGPTRRHSYLLEYGTDTVEVQEDTLEAGRRVVIVDDLLATGGTMEAALHLMRELGAEVPAAAFIIELSFLGGRTRLARHGLGIHALMSYDD